LIDKDFFDSLVLISLANLALKPGYKKYISSTHHILDEMHNLVKIVFFNDAIIDEIPW
jgi:hypothetical protein